MGFLFVSFSFSFLFCFPHVLLLYFVSASLLFSLLVFSCFLFIVNQDLTFSSSMLTSGQEPHSDELWACIVRVSQNPPQTCAEHKPRWRMASPVEEFQKCNIIRNYDDKTCMNINRRNRRSSFGKYS